jgi:hypothetical protein
MLHKKYAITWFLLIVLPSLAFAGPQGRSYDGLDIDRAIDRGDLPGRDRATIVRNPRDLPPCQQGPLIIPPCPAGTDLVIFDSPVYDDDGLFVICTKKVPYCIPEGLEPEG